MSDLIPPARSNADSHRWVRDEVRRLYRELDERVAEHRPVCQISGRCCQFREYGHTLFLSAIEWDYLVAEAPPPARPVDDGDTCPWQDQAGRCTARNARPLGCRVYFCDPAYDGVAEPLTEEFLGRLKAIADARGRNWDYAPLHVHLKRACTAGEQRFPRTDPARDTLDTTPE